MRGSSHSLGSPALFVILDGLLQAFFQDSDHLKPVFLQEFGAPLEAFPGPLGGFNQVFFLFQEPGRQNQNHQANHDRPKTGENRLHPVSHLKPQLARPLHPLAHLRGGKHLGPGEKYLRQHAYRKDPQEKPQQSQSWLREGFILESGICEPEQGEGKNPGAKPESRVKKIRQIRTGCSQQVGLVGCGNKRQKQENPKTGDKKDHQEMVAFVFRHQGLERGESKPGKPGMGGQMKRKHMAETKYN